MRPLVKVAGAAYAAAVAFPASANLATNGSFETFTGSFGGDGGAQLTPGVTTLTGWSVVGGEIAILENGNIYNLTAQDGTRFLDLTGYSNTGFPKGVSQTIGGLTAGQMYSVSLEVGVRNGPCVSGGNNCTGPVSVSATIGSASQTFTENSSAAGNVWGAFSLGFVATSPSMLLTIDGLSAPPGGEYIGLDNVDVEPGAVSAVPEPGTWALVASGLLLTVFGVRRRKPQSAI